MESRIPVVTNGVVSVNAAGSSPGKYSLSMNFFTALLISSGFIKNFGLARLSKCGSSRYGVWKCDTGCMLETGKSSGTRPSYSLSASSR
jgi:hypothetical protein